MDMMSLSVPNTLGEINQIQYQSNTVQNESIKYSTNESLNEDLCFGSYFRVVSYYFLPRIWNSKFFQRKSPAMLRCKTCLLQIVHFPFKRKIRMVAVDESRKSRTRRGWVMAVTSPTRMSHGWNTPGQGTSEPGTSGWTKQTWSNPSSFRAGSAYWVLNQKLGPEQPNICAHRNTCLQARQWIINFISQK